MEDKKIYHELWVTFHPANSSHSVKKEHNSAHQIWHSPETSSCSTDTGHNNCVTSTRLRNGFTEDVGIQPLIELGYVGNVGRLKLGIGRLAFRKFLYM